MSRGEDLAAEIADVERRRDEYAAEFARIAPDLIQPPRPPMTAEEEAELDEIMRATERMLNDEEDEDDEW